MTEQQLLAALRGVTLNLPDGHGVLFADADKVWTPEGTVLRWTGEVRALCAPVCEAEGGTLMALVEDALRKYEENKPESLRGGR